jgi:serine/threonine protein kinase
MANDNIIGKTVNGYEVTGVIGRGGMATVYKAHQISMSRTVALKVLPQQYVDDDTYIQRFKREVAIVARLEHRNIVPVYDYGEVERQPFIVMRYMPAGSVDSLLAHGPIPVDRIITILRQIAPALDYAHTKQVLHRDLKPSNILLDDGGGAYITDFGIARILGEASGNTITTQGVVGTPSYMSPEQAQGKPLDGRSDVYSLGVMLFEMATGKRPFESETPYGVAVMQVTTPPPQPRSINPALPPRVEQVIYKAMDKSADKRYQTCVELAEALDEAWNMQDQAEDTHKRAAFSKPPAYQAPVAPKVQPPSFSPPPYGPSINQSNASPRQAAWMPPVPSQRIPRKRRGNIWLSLLIGITIGCGLLAVLVAGTIYLLGEDLTSFFEDTAFTPSPVNEVDGITPGGINIISTLDPTSEAGRNDLLGQMDGNPTERATLIPTNTPGREPTENLPIEVEIITQTPNPDYTPTVAPIGVRPGG